MPFQDVRGGSGLSGGGQTGGPPWRPLEGKAAGGPWRPLEPLEVAGGPWRVLEAPRGSGISGDAWRPLKAGPWRPLEAPGGPCRPLEAPGCGGPQKSY